MRITDEAVEAVAKALNPDLWAEESLVPEVLRNSARWQKRHDVRAALTAALPHLEEAAPAPTRDAVVEALWQVRGMGPNPHRDHGYDAFCPVCMSNPYRIADALVAAGLIGGQR